MTQGHRWEILDHNIMPDSYVTYIVEAWRGNKSDPATEIVTYIGVWRGDQLETDERGAFDPNFDDVFKAERYGTISSYHFKPRPLAWSMIETTQESDHSALQHRDAEEALTGDRGYLGAHYGGRSSNGVTYEMFLEAIEAVAVNEEDEEAWDKIENWRLRQLPESERAYA